MMKHRDSNTECPPINRTYSSTNFEAVQIPVEFAVIHYTACSLNKTVEILCDPVRQVSTHLIIDFDGQIYELVSCLGEDCFKAWHSGKSKYLEANGTAWEAFNAFSIGIELVNLNGNIFNYSEEQYTSLIAVLKFLGSQHSALKLAERIVGHEQIAGFRGKSDPGACFDWNKIYSGIGAVSDELPIRNNRLSDSQLDLIRKISESAPSESDGRDQYFIALSQMIELMK